MSVEVSGSLRKLKRINQQCGGTGGVGGVAKFEAAADVTNMSPFGGAQVRIAERMKYVRLLVTELDEMGSRPNVAAKSEVSNNIRKELTKLKSELASAKKLAGHENKREDFETLFHHYKKTEAMYRGRFGAASSAEDGGGVGGGGGYGGTGTRRSGASPVELGEDFSVPGDGGAGYNIREDQEFLQFFAQTQKNDQAIDQALDRVGAGVQKLHESAQLISGELKVQNVLIDDTEHKLDNVSSNIKGLNTKLKETIKKVEEDKMCLYFFCFILLVGLAGGIYYLVAGDKSDSK